MEKQFTEYLLNQTKEWEKVKIRAPRLVQTVEKNGGVLFCRNMIKRGEVSETFDRLIELGKPELTVEAAVIRSEFSALFSDDEVNACFALLCEAGYFG